MNKNVYLLFAAIGTAVPWLFFASFFAAEGPDFPLFLSSAFANRAASGFGADLLISASVFLIWSYTDSRERGVRSWWVVIPAAFMVGLSLAMPLYLYLRASASR